MRVVALGATALLAACGASSSAPKAASPAPIGEHKGAPPPLDTAAIAGLPMAVVGLQSLPLGMGARTDRLLDAASYNMPCTDAIARKLTGYYWTITDDIADGLPPQILTGTMKVDEVVACLQAMEGGTRIFSNDPGVVALDSRHALFPLPHGGLAAASSPENLHALATAKPATNHPLAALVDPAPTTAEWTAVAFDYTWELLGVESQGVLLEYDAMYKSGPLAIRVRFHDAAAAKLARERFDHPDDVVARSVLGEAIADKLALIRSRGAVATEGRDVVIRGRIEESEWSENPLEIFRALAVPVGRPLTADERERLLRRR